MHFNGISLALPPHTRVVVGSVAQAPEKSGIQSRVGAHETLDTSQLSGDA